MRRARRAADTSALLFAHDTLGNNSYNMGMLISAREHLEATISLYDPVRDGVQATLCCSRS